ncbi:hypothetical protein BCR39DRAFT_516213 [Naematelia encephala]|uniref:Uncharacterized protein n=1 Tax=Naematelia encephala TaxID=71784 RepID=A0A1Y2BJR9_9TREE|nr:hypothetical protein BCR39DRAFT_516213 [Naematelia encephala]
MDRRVPAKPSDKTKNPYASTGTVAVLPSTLIASPQTPLPQSPVPFPAFYPTYHQPYQRAFGFGPPFWQPWSPLLPSFGQNQPQLPIHAPVAVPALAPTPAPTSTLVSGQIVKDVPARPNSAMRLHTGQGR